MSLPKRRIFDRVLSVFKESRDQDFADGFMNFDKETFNCLNAKRKEIVMWIEHGDFRIRYDKPYRDKNKFLELVNLLDSNDTIVGSRSLYFVHYSLYYFIEYRNAHIWLWKRWKIIKEGSQLRFQSERYYQSAVPIFERHAWIVYSFKQKQSFRKLLLGNSLYLSKWFYLFIGILV